VKRLARRKIVLVIVEGQSDDTALGVALNQLFDKDMVYVHIMHGDITTRKGIDSQNIVAKLGKEVTAFAKSRHYVAKDFKQIIHIVDTDGAYIPDNCVIEDLNSDSVIYGDNGIYTKDVINIIMRNKQKRENLYRLRTQGNIWKIPYRVYYMSCNLDHVLHNKRNSTDEEKENDAYAFAKKYKNNLAGFSNFMCNSDFSVAGDFKSSWEHVEKNLNSLKRFSNFGICVDENAKID
jgi:hypothetical protein